MAQLVNSSLSPALNSAPIRRLSCIYFWGIFAAFALAILSFRNPPAFQDFPDWVYQGVLFSRTLLGHPDPAYVPKHYPVPNSLSTIGIGLMATVLPWQIAAKLWLLFYFGLAIACTRHLLRTLAIDSHVLLFIVPSLVFLNLDFWYGHANFEIADCLLLLFVSILLRHRRDNLRLSMLLVVLFFTHMIPYAFAGLILLCYAVQFRSYRRLTAMVPSLLLTIAYTIGRYWKGGDVDAATPLETTIHYGSMHFWAFKLNTYFKALGYINAVSSRAVTGIEHSISLQLLHPMIFLFLLAMNVVLGLCLLFALALAIRLSFLARDGFRFLWIAILATVMGCLLAPQVALGVADPGSRLLSEALCVAIFLCARFWSRTTTILAVCSVTLSLANFYQFVAISRAPQVEGAVSRLPPALTTFAHVEPAGRLNYYRAIDAGRFDLPIFPTGLYYRRK